jgi:hypothetical protein
METFSSFKRKSLEKKKKTRTVLSEQRPKRKKPPVFLKNKIFYRFFSLFLIVVLGLISSYIFKNRAKILTAELYLSPETNFIIQNETAKLFAPDELYAIKKRIGQYLINKPQPLSSFVEDLQNIQTISHIHVQSNFENEIYISFTKRLPIFSIKSPSSTYTIANDGRFYSEPITETKPLPLLNGVFFENDKNENSKTNILPYIDDEQHRIILEAINLLDSIKLNFEITAIEYKKFRGFFVQTKDDLEVAIGRAPFNNKIIKLSSLIENLKSKNIIPKKIELDYDGKAFITQKPFQSLEGQTYGKR